MEENKKARTKEVMFNTEYVPAENLGVKNAKWDKKDGYDCNGNRICQYDVLKYRENDIKKLKKKYNTKEDFAEALSREMHYYYWSKAEWELIIERTNDNRVFLSPWCGCRNPEDVKIDVTAREDFDWIRFSQKYIQRGNDAKIDVWDQLKFRFNDFITYCWEYHHKWQRNNKKEENQ